MDNTKLKKTNPIDFSKLLKESLKEETKSTEKIIKNEEQKEIKQFKTIIINNEEPLKKSKKTKQNKKQKSKVKKNKKKKDIDNISEISYMSEIMSDINESDDYNDEDEDYKMFKIQKYSKQKIADNRKKDEEMKYKLFKARLQKQQNKDDGFTIKRTKTEIEIVNERIKKYKKEGSLTFGGLKKEINLFLKKINRINGTELDELYIMFVKNLLKSKNISYLEK